MDDLKKKAFNAVGWDLLGMLFLHGVGLVISIFLARLLEPEEFGIIGMSMVFITLSNVFMEAGFSTALIQKLDCKPITYSSIFYVNIASGILIFIIFQISAKPIAQFYELSEIENIVKLLAYSVPIASLNIIQSTLLTKSLKFKELSIRSVVAGSVSGILGVILAFKGFGVYALVYQYIMYHVLNTILLWKIGSWKPLWVFSFSEVKEVFTFGGYVLFANILNQFFLKANTLIIGKFFSPATLGYFTRAQSLVELVTKYSSTSLNKVLFPTLSLLKENQIRFNNSLLKVLNFSSFMIFFLGGCLFFLAEPIILILFGDKWLPSVFIFEILILCIYSYPINSIIISAILASGLAKEHFWHANARNVIRLLSPILGIYYGFEAFLYGLVIVALINTLYNMVLISYIRNISFVNLFCNIFKYIGIAVFLVLILSYLKMEVYLPYLINVIKAGLFAVFFLVLSYLIEPNIRDYSLLLYKLKSNKSQ